MVGVQKVIIMTTNNLNMGIDSIPKALFTSNIPQMLDSFQYDIYMLNLNAF